MLIGENTLHVYNDGTVNVSGVDMGGKVTLHELAPHIVTIKVAGFNYSTGNGNALYIGAEFNIGEVLSIEKPTDSNAERGVVAVIRCKRLAEVPIKASGKAVLLAKTLAGNAAVGREKAKA